MLGRREFLVAGAAGAAALALGTRVGVAADAGRDPWGEAFAKALRNDSHWLGWRSVEADRMKCGIRVEGHLPESLRGTLFRNGPPCMTGSVFATATGSRATACCTSTVLMALGSTTGGA